jgi:hypothetical protein
VNLLFIVILLFVFACGTWVCLVICKKARFRLRFSLTSLLTAVAVVALALGLAQSWPRHILSVRIPRIEPRQNGFDFTQDAAVVDIFGRARRVTVQVIPRRGFAEAYRVELFWLESGDLRHEAVVENGNILATTFSMPSEWPLVIGVVEYHAETIVVVARWVLSDGRHGGANAYHATDDPLFDGGIEKWGQAYLERTRKHSMTNTAAFNVHR